MYYIEGNGIDNMTWHTSTKLEAFDDRPRDYAAGGRQELRLLSAERVSNMVTFLKRVRNQVTFSYRPCGINCLPTGS